MMKDRLKRLLSLILALSMLLTLTACGQEEEEDDSAMTIDPNQSTVAVKAADDVFSLGYDADGDLNPLTTKSQANYIVGCLVYETAVELDKDYNPIGNIITSWNSDNGFSWMFTVDTSVTFHDGSYVTPEDVAYSIDRARNSEIYKSRLNEIWGISAIGDKQVMITLSDTNYLFPRLLNVPIIQKGSNADLPNGTGQYMFDEDMTKLVKYADHRYAENTPLDVIYLQNNGTPDEKIAAYNSSVVDLVVNDPTSLSRLGYGTQNEVRHFATTNMHYIGFNVAEEFTCYQYCRYPLNFAVDREYIVDRIYNGSAMAATLPIPPTSDYYNKGLADQYKYDLTTAARLFTAQGIQDYDGDNVSEYQLPGGIAEITLDFIVAADNTDKVKAAQKICDDLQSIGIPVTLRQLSWQAYRSAIVEGQYDMCYAEVKLTADFSLQDMLSTHGGKNFYNMADPQVYDLIQAYLGSVSETDRKNNCDTMCKYIADNAYIVPILFEEQQVLTHRDVVSGMEPTQYNIFTNFKNWVIDPTAGLVDADNDGKLDVAGTPEPENHGRPQATKRPIPTQQPSPDPRATATIDHSPNPTVTPDATPTPEATEEPAPTPEVSEVPETE